jgi:hypothetical protein
LLLHQTTALPEGVRRAAAAAECTRAARFFMAQYATTGKNIPYHRNITKWPQNLPNGRKMFQMTIKCTKIVHSKALQKLPQTGIFGLKIDHLASLECT